MKFTINPDKIDINALIKRIFWLAYNASEVYGMGHLQKVDNATEDAVWDNIKCSGDYPINRNGPGEWTADYVFGKMMKLRVEYDDNNEIFVAPGKPNLSYNSWGIKYKSADELVEAAKRSLHSNCN